MFLTTSNITFVCTQFIVTSNVLTVKHENHKQCIFPILPVNVPQSYILNVSITVHNILSIIVLLRLPCQKKHTTVTVPVLQYC